MPAKSEPKEEEQKEETPWEKIINYLYPREMATGEAVKNVAVGGLEGVYELLVKPPMILGGVIADSVVHQFNGMPDEEYNRRYTKHCTEANDWVYGVTSAGVNVFLMQLVPWL